MAETHQPYDGYEKRKIDPERKIFTLDQQAALVVVNRFKGQRPSGLDTEIFKEGERMRRAVTRIFNHLEGKIDVVKIEALKNSFERSIKPWADAGLFSQEREAGGYRRPDFERDYQPLFGEDDFEMMEAGAELNRGYNRLVWAPEDVLFASEDPGTLSYLKLLEEALLKAYRGTTGGKQANTLLVGPNKRVLTADTINLKEILWQWEGYKQHGIVHNPQQLNPKKHGGKSEAEMLASLKGIEKETGGTLRLERDSLIMPKDVGKEVMSARDWHATIKDGKTFPPQVRAQDSKQALAYIMHCLNTQGWIPDFYDDNDPANSRVALAPETYIPNESSAGAVPAFDWRVVSGQFGAGGYLADGQRSGVGVRPGVRKNNEAA